MKGYLLVRAQGKVYGLPVGRVLEVGDATEVLSVPRKLPAVRGLTPLRGRLVPLIHLGAFLTGTEAPAAPSAVRTVVLVELGATGGGGGRQVAFEVDDVDAVVREQPLPVPRGQTLPWAVGVAEQESGLVPILDLDALGDRIA
ncbi:MAG TPA: chemotaxis protein CheW [Gemmatimonadales bacterium]|jgi:chemotaxis signal transduction protein|nr:chemotaxis protein CheW [Gemmatimonadales bacterium]